MNKTMGNSGEEKAIVYLRNLGYTISQKNFKSKTGEIDIIAEKDNLIIFIEVKSRKNDNYGYPRESVHKYKQNKIIKTAQCYIKMKRLKDVQFRFDVIEIYINRNWKVNHIIDAFWQ